MEFVINCTPRDFQAKNFTPSISPNFNTFSDKNVKKELNGEIYTTEVAKIFHCRWQGRQGQISPHNEL